MDVTPAAPGVSVGMFEGNKVAVGGTVSVAVAVGRDVLVAVAVAAGFEV
jgi:hypothetical protein